MLPFFPGRRDLSECQVFQKSLVNAWEESFTPISTPNFSPVLKQDKIKIVEISMFSGI